MSLRFHFASLSMDAAVDQQTGSLSVFDVIEEIRTPIVPFTLQSLVLAVTVEKTIPTRFVGKLHIQLITPDEKTASVGYIDVQIPAEQKRMRSLFRFDDFPIQSFGPHRIVLIWLQGPSASGPASGQSNSETKIGESVLNFDVIQVT